MNKEQLEQLSDLQINRIIAFEANGRKPNKSVMKHQDSGLCATNYKDDAVSICDNGDLGFYNYCNDPSDMMPLVFESRITIDYHICDLAQCYKYTENGAEHTVEHSNPLRAAAIVYLLMRGEL
jgi:hypothetical protein